MRQKYSNKIEADLMKQMTAIALESVVSWWVVFLYFRVSFISILSPKKCLTTDFHFSFFYVQKQKKSNVDFISLIFNFLIPKTNKNWTQIFIFHYRCILGITSRDGFKLILVSSVRYFLVVEKGLLRISWDLSSWNY